MGLAAVALDERPGATQLLGAALILVGVVVATSAHSREPSGAIVLPEF
jgi:drug/metabolite transporter (DMT)-like permease